jgi:hypothetical protein
MDEIKKAVKLRLDAHRRRALAPDYDPVRHEFEVSLSKAMEEDAQALLAPSEPLEIGLGGEIIPRVEQGLVGFESVLKEPDLLSAEASRQRAVLLEGAEALELGIETAEQLKAGNAVEQMLCHQMAAAHRRALTLLAQSDKTSDPQVACLKAKTAARLMAAFTNASMTLQRLQHGAGVQQIQQVHVSGNAVVGQIAER